MTTCELIGATRISDLRVQDRAKVTGTISSAQTTAIGSSLGYRCVLADGTGQLDLLFLGRPVIAGLATGTRCSIDGVVAARGARLAVWNPRYEVQPAQAPPVTGAESSAADAARPAARPAGPRRDLSGRAGFPGSHPLLPRRQPDRAPGAGAAVPGR
jgi:hypothetical protein